ncbi:excisionase family DNA-binding protein [Streptomyces collinus]|uniref:excisionase family DNA-binding protein n=1 Tax=Streptomyces collinus TaxID=42684 RepID=UPI003822CB42
MSITDMDPARLSKANGLAPVLLTVEEAATCLRIGRTTCFALIRSGELESLLIGGLRRVPADAPAAFLARRRAERQAA